MVLSVAIDKNANPTDQEKLEELTIEWMDFLYENHLDTGVAQGERGSLYNHQRDCLVPSAQGQAGCRGWSPGS